MKDISFVKKKEPEELYHARITSIDRNKGRVTLFMKNGLFSIGHYLHDLNDLRENMTVLVGKVNDSHVILSKIPANPSNSQSLSSPSPSVNYDGVDYIKFIKDDVVIIDDHFTTPTIDSSVWGGSVKGFNYETVDGAWTPVPRTLVYYSETVSDFYQVVHPDTIFISNSILRYNTVAGYDFHMFSKESGKLSSTVCSLEAGFRISLLTTTPPEGQEAACAVYRIDDYAPSESAYPPSRYGIGEAGEGYYHVKIIVSDCTWSCYYKLNLNDAWILVSSLKRTTLQGYPPYYDNWYNSAIVRMYYNIYGGLTIRITLDTVFKQYELPEPSYLMLSYGVVAENGFAAPPGGEG